MLLVAPTGTIGGSNPSARSNESLFIQYLNHFIYYSKSSAINKILLMDNHEFHMKLEAIN